MIRRGLVFGGGLIVLAGPALAADYSQAMYPPPAHPISGYVDLHGGWDSGSESGVDDCCGHHGDSWSGSVLGAAGRVAVGLSPNISVQTDAWTNVFNGSGSGHYAGAPFSYDYHNAYWGFAGHLTWHTMEGSLFGVFASAGEAADRGGFGTVGVEAVHNFNNLRFYGQVGLSGALSGDAEDNSASDLFAEGVIAYYFTPNFRLSGNLGYDASSDDTNGGTTVDTTRWGAHLEYKPGSIPVSGFLAYAGSSSSGSNDNPDRWSVGENAVVAGIRILYDSNGKTTLRRLDDSVGLSDMNHTYGKSFVH